MTSFRGLCQLPITIQRVTGWQDLSAFPCQSVSVGVSRWHPPARGSRTPQVGRVCQLAAKRWLVASVVISWCSAVWWREKYANHPAAIQHSAGPHCRLSTKAFQQKGEPQGVTRCLSLIPYYPLSVCTEQDRSTTYSAGSGILVRHAFRPISMVLISRSLRCEPPRFWPQY
jgi:hypothetical protein